MNVYSRLFMVVKWLEWFKCLLVYKGINKMCFFFYKVIFVIRGGIVYGVIDEFWKYVIW